ncbi:ABC transporter substrate-binding protein [Bacillus atrophaeus]|uniref:ABC transporter substrate-binding protein n=1 Tax=Bacillus atrophaeus TaxID=1452 RepID=UPI00227E4982|nr:iron-siderophore ABC transporter substrate-binding protein [Bacillus atrophaeus]MCY8858640.1 iron-siderophore ABC transporter substrate-binding protein [Bacillus atrophaeus]
MKKQITMLFVFVMAIMVLSACNSSGSSNDSKGNSSETRTIKHAMGTSTNIPANPKRIVVLTNEGTEALLALGITPVGAVRSWKGDPWYDYIKSDMKNVKDVGLETEPNVEAIAELEPDLIIGNKVRQEKIYDQLNKIAPTVFAESLAGNWKDNLTLYANAVNKADKGKEVIQTFNKRVSDISGKLGDQKNKTVSVVRFMSGESRIYYKDSFSGIILDELGFKRPEKQKELFKKQKDQFIFSTDSKESIPDMDGDILFYFTYTADNAKDNVKWQNQWTSDPLWKNLKAVKSGNAHEVDDIVWTTAGGIKAANLLLDDIETTFLKTN